MILSRQITVAGNGGNIEELLQDIRFSKETGLPYCVGIAGKAGLQPVLNDVPCLVLNGEDDNCRYDVDSKGLPYIETFIRIDGGDGDYRFISTGSNDLSTEDRSNTLMLGSDNKLRFLVQDEDSVMHILESDNDYLTSSDILFVQAEYDGDLLTLNIYKAVNDTLILQEGKTLQIGSVVVYQNSNNITLGRWKRLVGLEYPFTGLIFGYTYKNNGNTIINSSLQCFSDNKVWDNSGNGNHGTISGSGQWWTRANGIPSPNQAKGFKLATYDGIKEAYVPLNIQDAEIEAAYLNVSSIVELIQDGRSFLGDGSTLNLHEHEVHEVLSYADEMVAFDNYSTLNPLEISWDEGGIIFNISNSAYLDIALNIENENSYLLEYEVLEQMLGTSFILSSSSFGSTIALSKSLGKHSVLVTSTVSYGTLKIGCGFRGLSGKLKNNISLRKITSISDALFDANAPLALIGGESTELDIPPYKATVIAGQLTKSIKLPKP